MEQINRGSKGGLVRVERTRLTFQEGVGFSHRGENVEETMEEEGSRWMHENGEPIHRWEEGTECR